jgi:hypothetical protein
MSGTDEVGSAVTWLIVREVFITDHTLPACEHVGNCHRSAFSKAVYISSRTEYVCAVHTRFCRSVTQYDLSRRSFIVVHILLHIL